MPQLRQAPRPPGKVPPKLEAALAECDRLFRTSMQLDRDYQAAKAACEKAAEQDRQALAEALLNDKPEPASLVDKATDQLAQLERRRGALKIAREKAAITAWSVADEVKEGMYKQVVARKTYDKAVAAYEAYVAAWRDHEQARTEAYWAAVDGGRNASPPPSPQPLPPEPLVEFGQADRQPQPRPVADRIGHDRPAHIEASLRFGRDIRG